jgi:hypothetical protein
VVALGLGGDTAVEKARKDLEDAQLRGDQNAISTAMRKLAAAYSDVSMMIPRGLAGAIDTALIRPARAISGARIPYLGSVIDTESATPATDEFERDQLMRSAYGPGTRNLAAATEAASATPDLRAQLNQADAALRSAAGTPASSRSSAAGAPGAPGAPGAVKPAASTVDPLAALEQAYKARNEERIAGAKTPQEVADARAAEAKLMQENLKAALDEARTAREAAEKRRANVVEAASRSILEDPEALLKLAGGMNTRRGMGIGSLAAGAGAELGRRREAMQAAEEKFAGEQKELRALDAANRQYNLSITQLQKAYAEGDAEKIRAAKQDVADSGVKLQEAKMDYGLKQRKVGAEEMTARAHMISAGKPSSAGELINFFKTDPEGFKRYIATQVEPKNEGSLARALVVEAVKNPAMLGIIKDQNPDLYNLMQQEIARSGGGGYGAPPPGAVREKGKG